MGSFRDQMQRLADEITKTRRERKSCVVRIAKDREQLRDSVAKQREQTQRELAKQAHELGRELSTFNRQNKKAVSQSLRETRLERTSRARTLKSTLRQETAANRRNVARALRQHCSERQRVQRQQVRTAALTLQSIKQHVHRIRTTTNRMTRVWAIDRNEAKRIWERLHASPIINRIQPPQSPIASAVAAMPALSSTTLSATGLALPPAR
jgi:hypothetical protein